MASGPVIDEVTIISLSTITGLLVVAYGLSGTFLPKDASSRSRILFVWHFFDALVHFLFEGSFLYNCFFTYVQLPGPPSYLSSIHAVLTPPDVFFLGQKTRLYGSAYGTSPTAKLWQEYAKADRRWGGADLTVISLELLTVFIGGPLAVFICYLLSKGQGDVAALGSGTKKIGGKLAFWLIVLATGELYGGFMTFAPEWLSGNPNLDGSNWMYMYLYLCFFNLLWVFLPIYALYEAYQSLIGSAPATYAEITSKKKT